MSEYIHDYATRSRIESLERELGSMKRKQDDDGSGFGGCVTALLYLALLGALIWYVASKPEWDREKIAECVKRQLGTAPQCTFWVRKDFAP